MEESKTQSESVAIGKTAARTMPSMSSWSLFWRRRKFIVDTKLQFSVMGLVLFSNVLFVCALAASLFIPLAIAMNSSTHPLAPEARQILALDRKLWPAAALGLMIVSLMSLALSHRIAGPMVRIKSALRQLANREEGRPVTLREKDFFKDVASLVEDVRRSNFEHNAAVIDEIQSIAKDVTPENRARLEQVIAELKPQDA